MIPIEQEDEEMFNNTLCYEKCYFCKEETDMWHTPTNTPVCEKCAAIKDRKDIKKPQIVITIQ
jgi:hypothetical protein